MSGSDLVTLEHVSKSYTSDRTFSAVSDLSLSLGNGEILALLGPSGSGKTTTLRLIAGFEHPDQGRVLLQDVPVSGDGFWVPPEKRRIGMVFQDYALFPHLTVWGNVMFGLRASSKSEREARAMEALAIVGMEGMARRYPHELSGGQQQRVSFARAIAPNPVVLLLDEPFSNLDADMRAEMREELLKILRASHMSAMIVTHDQEEAFVIADRVGVLNMGALEQLSSPETLYHSPRTRFVADFVGKADFIVGEVREKIETELGSFPNDLGLSPGSRVELVLRPDEVEFEPSARGNATVTKRRFRGSENVYTVALDSGQQLHSHRPASCVVPPHTRVRVTLRTERPVVFPFHSG